MSSVTASPSLARSVGEMVGEDGLVGTLTAKGVEGLTAPGRYTDGDGLMLVIDSVAHRKVASVSGITFAAAARAVHAEQKAGWRNGKHCDQWLATLENHAFPQIGDRPIASLTRADMVDVLSPIWLSHQETARRVLQRMRSVINWSVGKEIRAEGIDFEIVRRALPRQRKKVRHMPAIHFTEVRSFMEALAFSKATPVVRGAIAHVERRLISERTKGGIVAARARGKRPGRQRLDAAKVEAAIKLVDAGISPEEAAKQLGIGRSTIYREMRRLGVKRPQ
jgi:hypothetical protein